MRSKLGALAVLLFLLNRAAGADLALTGGTIYPDPDSEPVTGGVVLIRDGSIAAVGAKGKMQLPPGVQILDCSGMTIAAGFWNSHVHFMERKWADAKSIPAAELSSQMQAMLTRFGFTSVFDTGSVWQNTRLIRDRVESGEVDGPRIRSTGDILMPKGATRESPPTLLDALGFMRSQYPEIGDADEAVGAAKKLLDAGTDGIKLYAATWFPPFVSIPEPAMKAAAAEAHRRGKPVFAHPTNRNGLLASVRAGADVLVHTTPESGPWDQAVLAAMKEKRVALIPTLTLWRYELRHDRETAQKRFMNAASAQLRAWQSAGGTILFGTDVGYTSAYDPAEEYQLMAGAGMSFRQILASLTTAPAKRFDASKQFGRIAPGLTADLVVLAGDPAADVRALADVRYTIREGKIIYRAGR